MLLDKYWGFVHVLCHLQGAVISDNVVLRRVIWIVLVPMHLHFVRILLGLTKLDVLDVLFIQVELVVGLVDVGGL